MGQNAKKKINKCGYTVYTYAQETIKHHDLNVMTISFWKCLKMTSSEIMYVGGPYLYNIISEVDVINLSRIIWMNLGIKFKLN